MFSNRGWSGWRNRRTLTSWWTGWLRGWTRRTYTRTLRGTWRGRNTWGRALWRGGRIRWTYTRALRRRGRTWWGFTGGFWGRRWNRLTLTCRRANRLWLRSRGWLWGTFTCGGGGRGGLTGRDWGGGRDWFTLTSWSWGRSRLTFTCWFRGGWGERCTNTSRCWCRWWKRGRLSIIFIYIEAHIPLRISSPWRTSFITTITTRRRWGIITSHLHSSTLIRVCKF